MTSLRKGLVSVALVSFLSTVSLADAIYDSKATLRLNNGIIRNMGKAKGASLSIGGVNFSYAYFILSKLAVTGGYHIDFDYARKTIPLSGFEFGARYYIKGQGTRSREVYQGGVLERRDSFAAYLATEIAQQSYYIGSNPPERGEAILSGNSLGVNLAAGLDQRITDDLDLTLEANAGVLSFAAQDDRFRLSAFLIKIGVSYLW